MPHKRFLRQEYSNIFITDSHEILWFIIPDSLHCKKLFYRSFDWSLVCSKALWALLQLLAFHSISPFLDRETIIIIKDIADILLIQNDIKLGLQDVDHWNYAHNLFCENATLSGGNYLRSDSPKRHFPKLKTLGSDKNETIS